MDMQWEYHVPCLERLLKFLKMILFSCTMAIRITLPTHKNSHSVAYAAKKEFVLLVCGTFKFIYLFLMTLITQYKAMCWSEIEIHLRNNPTETEMNYECIPG